MLVLPDTLALNHTYPLQISMNRRSLFFFIIYSDDFKMDVSGTSGSSLSWERSSLNLDRRTAREQDEDLLVFGYSCKLFKDDAKANHIERGEHLIPWSGNESGEMSIQIDR